jgi:hypothetical protein
VEVEEAAAPIDLDATEEDTSERTADTPEDHILLVAELIFLESEELGHVPLLSGEEELTLPG